VDFSGGIAYQYRNVAGNLVGKDIFELNAGASCFHINKPEQRFYAGSGNHLNMRIVLHTQVRYDFPKTRWSLRPSAYYMKQGPIGKELVFGTLLRYRIKNGTKITNFSSEQGLGFGVHYRWKDAIMPQLYYDLGDFFIGLSYDLNISKYSQVSRMNGGFEITLRYANLNGAWYKGKR
jgi:hypothetical protein